MATQHVNIDNGFMSYVRSFEVLSLLAQNDLSSQDRLVGGAKSGYSVSV